MGTPFWRIYILLKITKSTVLQRCWICYTSSSSYNLFRSAFVNACWKTRKASRLTGVGLRETWRVRQGRRKKRGFKRKRRPVRGRERVSFSVEGWNEWNRDELRVEQAATRLWVLIQGDNRTVWLNKDTYYRARAAYWTTLNEQQKTSPLATAAYILIWSGYIQAKAIPVNEFYFHLN